MSHERVSASRVPSAATCPARFIAPIRHAFRLVRKARDADPARAREFWMMPAADWSLWHRTCSAVIRRLSNRAGQVPRLGTREALTRSSRHHPPSL